MDVQAFTPVLAPSHSTSHRQCLDYQPIEEKRHHNFNLPISTLPEEILLEILKDVVLSQLSCRDPTHPTKWAPLKLKVSNSSYRSIEQVCSRWREIILGCPSIWVSKIDSTDDYLSPRDKWRIELFRRSEPSPCPLSVTYRIAESSFEYLAEIHRIAERNLQRINTIRITIEDLEAFAGNSHIFVERTPILEFLQIHSYVHGLLAFDGELHAQCRLKTLDIRNVLIDPLVFESKPYSELRKLRVWYSGYDASRLGTKQWQLILRNLPKIEVIEITDIDSPGVSSPNIDLQPIYLEHLSTLSLVNESSYMFALLSNISIPPTCSLHLSICEITLDMHFYTILEIIHRHLTLWSESGRSFATCWEISIYAQGIEIVDALYPEMVGTGRAQFDCSFRLKETFNEDMVKAIMTAIQPILPHARIVRLLSLSESASNLDRGLPLIFKALMGGLTEVEELVNPILDNVPFHLCMDDKAELIFPKLTKLTINNPSFTVADLPEAFIRWRHRVGRPLKEVVIKRRSSVARVAKRLSNIPGLRVYGVNDIGDLPY